MRLFTTDNLQLTTKHRAFTLMEVLIATGIFAAVMVITVGILGQSSSFRGKIKATRETTSETRKIADMITRDVRSANKSFVAPLGSPDTGSHKDGILIGLVYSSAGNSMYIPRYGSAAIDYSSGANLLMLANSNEYIIYYKRVINGQGYLFRKTYLSSADLTTSFEDDFLCSPTDLACFVGNKENAISNKNLNVVLDLAGFAPDDRSANQQLFVKFRITAETLATDPNNHYKSEIESTVTSRSFAN